MSTNVSALPSRHSGRSVPPPVNRIRICAGEKISASDPNGDMFQRLREPVPNGTLGDSAIAFNEIQLALSKISSNLGKLVPVGRQHVVPPAIAAFVQVVFLILIRQSVGNITSAVLFIILLTSFAWPVWTTLKLMDRRLDEINAKMGVLQHSLTSVDYVPIIHPGLVDEAPSQRETLERNMQPIEPREALQDKPPVNVKKPEHCKISVTPEPEREDEPPAILDETDPTSAALEPRVVNEPPATADKPGPIQAHAELKVHHGPPATTDKQGPVPVPAEHSGQDQLNVDIPTISVSPAPLESERHVEQAIVVSIGQPSRQPEPSYDHWSSTLLEIKQRIEPLAEGSLLRLPQSVQREPFDLIALRRIATRLLMYCASLSTADFASPNGFFGPPALVPYYPTGDIDRDRNVAFTTALDCLDELLVLLTGNAKAEIAAALFELAQALNDLGLHEYASSVSGFALEILRDLYAADPDQFRSRITTILSLRANILVDLRQNDDAVDAAEEAVTILKEHGETQPELVYAMLNYAVLLGSIGRGESAVAVAFELVGLIDDSTNMRPDMILVAPLCRLCSSNAFIEFDSDLALSEVDKVIEESRASSDGNSNVVLAGAILTKSKILSSRGQNDPAYAISAEAVTLFRSASADRHIFTFLLAHAVATHSHQLSEANHKVESYSTMQEAVELWQTLQSIAPVATRRPLAWALFELAKYRRQGVDKQTRRNELQIAETAVSTFREVQPLDHAGLANALYLYAERMLELDNNRDAATYAEESVQYFREAKNESPHKHSRGLVFSLSLASSCLARTERDVDALEYAKRAVELQHERKGHADAHYDNHLRNLLTDVVFRFTEMGRQEDALPWMQELQQLGMPGDMGNVTGQLARRGSEPQPKNDMELGKQSSYWTNASNSAPRLNNNFTTSAAAEPSSSMPRVLAEEGTLSPAATAQYRDDELAGMCSPRGGSFGPGDNNDLMSNLLGMGGAAGPRSSNNDPLNGLLGMGAMGGASGPRSGINDPLGGLLGMGGMGGRAPRNISSPPLPTGLDGRPLGSPIQTARPPPAAGRAAGGRLGGMSGMAGLESLLSGFDGLDPSGFGGLDGRGGGGFDTGMFDPDLFGPGSDRDQGDGSSNGTTGTSTEGGGDDTPRSGMWSGMGIQSKLSDS